MSERSTHWLRFAEEDLNSAKILLREGIYNKVCFHSQQCAENSLKALLVFRHKNPPKTHSLIELLRLVAKLHKDFQCFEESCRRLDQFYLPTRYADALVGTLPQGLPTEEHAREAVESAESLLSSVNEATRTKDS